ncbi:hypothetical protein GGX14DRAFT_608555 [Mycena pura]|uniref:Uncharacterized protein n=1 Tax=Mycena pura TaxID=153505 RepID=A0AAD6VKA2_9AGAR|nr:hypothetical protein GGX14DRAFT_608555 [Mycena pura]
MVKKYSNAEQTQAPADSANTAVKAAQMPSLFAIAAVLQDSPAVKPTAAQGKGEVELYFGISPVEPNFDPLVQKRAKRAQKFPKICRDWDQAFSLTNRGPAKSDARFKPGQLLELLRNSRRAEFPSAQTFENAGTAGASCSAAPLVYAQSTIRRWGIRGPAVASAASLRPDHQIRVADAGNHGKLIGPSLLPYVQPFTPLYSLRS